MNKCLNCEQETENPKFCCRSCSVTYNNRKNPKRQLKKSCKLCNKPIRSQSTYCNECLKSIKNNIQTTKTISKNGKPYYKHHERKKRNICLNCGKLANNKFCSRECSNKYRTQAHIQKVEQDGFFYGKDCYTTSVPFVKTYIKDKYGDKCSICGHESTWQDKPLVLVLDHINGIPNDWSINNLRLVCPNCDSQLPTFKSKNKNGGRPIRSKRQVGESNSSIPVLTEIRFQDELNEPIVDSLP